MNKGTYVLAESQLHILTNLIQRQFPQKVFQLETRDSWVPVFWNLTVSSNLIKLSLFFDSILTTNHLLFQSGSHWHSELNPLPATSRTRTTTTSTRFSNHGLQSKTSLMRGPRSLKHKDWN